MSETTTRLLTALVIAPAAVYLIVLGGWIWTTALLVVAVLCEVEFFNLMEAKGLRPHREIALAVTVALLCVAHVAGMELAAGMLTAGVLGLLVAHLARPSIGQVIPSISVTMAAVMYVGWLVSHAIYLRDEVGVFGVLFAIVTTALNDTGAYFAGRSFGRHPAAPTISPKKTVEGVVGGVAAAAAAALLLKAAAGLWFDPVPYGHGFLLAIGIANGVIGFCGDLVESLIKRDAEVNDTGTLLPGHGGVLDRIDSYLFTVPFTFYAFTVWSRFAGG